MKKWGPAAIVATSVLLVGSFFIPKDTSSVKEGLVKAFENTMVLFDEASVETKIMVDEDVVYVETIDVVKTDEGSTYTSEVKELSDSLLDDEMYKTSTSTGSYTKEETIGLFGAVASLDYKVITNVEKLPVGTDSYTIRFTILNKHLDETFGDGMASKINGHVKFEAILVEGVVESYEYTFDYIDGSKVSVKGEFK